MNITLFSEVKLLDSLCDSCIHERICRFEVAAEEPCNDYVSINTRQSHWVEVPGKDWRKYHICSECKAYANGYEDVAHVFDWLTPFCPYCGLPMGNADPVQNVFMLEEPADKS